VTLKPSGIVTAYFEHLEAAGVLRLETTRPLRTTITDGCQRDVMRLIRLPPGSGKRH
jgi:hypothetical protein